MRATVLVQVLADVDATAEFLALAAKEPLIAGVAGWVGLTAGLTYDLLTQPHQLPAAIEAAPALPHLTFVLDHLSKPIATGELESLGDSDWPVCLPAACYARVVIGARELTAELSEAERAAVFAGTAQRVYRLGIP